MSLEPIFLEDDWHTLRNAKELSVFLSAPGGTVFFTDFLDAKLPEDAYRCKFLILSSWSTVLMSGLTL
jgi:hypothetical protein